MTELKPVVRNLRCAVYTRKSSEEGLEQTFNSIDAQREACEAYVVSQRHEGWKILPTRYDDGGFSGGSLERPAVQRLLADIQSGKVDLVVVYKIDRLTRALSDFAKMVEIFDAHNASFVSVTQHFNTTTSMGRLTLNVLLSFAQFEREVTGERIRDKIAASKKKGMWMGGTVPLGYDALDRKLMVNSAESELVRDIYTRYLALGDVTRLKAELDRMGQISKQRTSRGGNASGGMRFFRGALYTILKNRIYLGEIVHRGTVYPGEHEGIVPKQLWDVVQEQLRTNSKNRKRGTKAKESSLLAGWVFDAEGRRLIPSHANKRGKRYRYYVVREDSKDDGYKPVKISVPAHDLESTIVGAITYWLEDVPTLLADLKLKRTAASRREAVLCSAEALAQTIREADQKSLRAILTPIMGRITVGTEDIQIQLRRSGVRKVLGNDGGTDTTDHPETDDLRDTIMLRVQASLQRSGLEMKLVVAEAWAETDTPTPDWALIKAVARSHVWMQKLLSGEVSSIQELCRTEKVSDVYLRRILRCATLAPDVVEAILEGRQPSDVTLQRIVYERPPLLWAEQRVHYGVADR